MQCCTPYTHTHTHTHTYTHTHTHTHTHTGTHTHIHHHHTPHNHHHHIQEMHTQHAGTLLVWQYWQYLTGLVNSVRTHTHTHTHTHTRAYSAGKCTKVSTNMHSKQVLSPVHEICRFLWILKAKKLFARASLSEVRVCHLCRQFQSEIVRAKAFPRYRHLPNLSDSRRSPTSASLLSLFRWSDVKAFETAAIEDDAGTKNKRWCTFRQNITQMFGQEVEWPSVPRVEAYFSEKGDSKVAHYINAFICNA